MNVTDGINQRIVCVSEGVRPAAKLTWTYLAHNSSHQNIDPRNTIIQNVTEQYETTAAAAAATDTSSISTDNTQILKSVLNFIPTMKDQGATLICRADYSAPGQAHQIAKVQLLVQSPSMLQNPIASFHADTISTAAHTISQPSDITLNWNVSFPYSTDRINYERFLTPLITRQPNQSVCLGQYTRLDCAIQQPVPIPNVEWTFANTTFSVVDIQTAYSAYNTSAHIFDNGTIKTSLVIRNLQMSHFGVYRCTVFNQYGTDFIEIQLKQI